MPWTLRMLLLTFAIILIPYIYIGWRTFNAAAVFFPYQVRILKFTIIGIFIFINLFPLIAGFYYLVGEYRNLFVYSDQFSILDILFQYPYWIGLIIILEVLPYFLASDFILLISRWFSLGVKANITKWMSLVKLAFLFFFILFVSIRAYLDTNQITIARHQISVKNLPSALTNLEFVLVADIQIDRYTPQTKVKNYLKKMDTTNADFIFFAGDLVTRGTYFIDQALDVMCRSNAQIARVACLGDHDIWSDTNRISAGFQKCGWAFLDDQHQLIDYQGHQILITGVSYAYSKRISPARLKQLLQSAPQADLKILLVHQPSKMVLNSAAEYGYDIFLAGHTHGGQIILKPFGITLTPTQVENDFFSGWDRINGMNVLISDGIGMSLVPIRYRAQGKINQFTLVQE